jgi:hypothetical protein
LILHTNQHYHNMIRRVTIKIASGSEAKAAKAIAAAVFLG